VKKFLAIDTSCNFLTVLVSNGEGVFARYLPDCLMGHSVNLMTEIDGALKEAGIVPADCDFFAATVGAGSFTGIRIGIATAKGFALACGKPTLPITSFDVAAYNAIDGFLGKRLVLVDAGHDAYYVCGYDGESVCLPPAYLSEEEVLAIAASGYRLMAAGALPLCEKAEVEIVSPVSGLQKAVELLSCREDAFGELTALYVRKSSAELNLEKGEKKL